MERQKHGFNYQEEVIERFGLVKDENYMAECRKNPYILRVIPAWLKNSTIYLTKNASVS